jgi:hypothetical protein
MAKNPAHTDTERLKAPLELFLLCGQSNMQGFGNAKYLNTSYLEDLKAVDFYFRYPLNPETGLLLESAQSKPTELRVISLQPGSSGNSIEGQDFGPEIGFGHRMRELKPSRRIAIIKYAVGGTSLSEHWDPAHGVSFRQFSDTVERGIEALSERENTVDVSGILWTQGERDIVIGQAKNYRANLGALIHTLRQSFGINLPFLFSKISNSQTDLICRSSRGEFEKLRQAQDLVSKDSSLNILIETDDLKVLDDCLHFDTSSTLHLGRRFADAVIENGF